MLQGGVMGMQANPPNLRYCYKTGRVAGIFPLAVAEGEWMCCGSEGGLAGTGLQSTSLLQGSIAPLVLPSAVGAALSLPAQAAGARISISSPALCLHKPQEQSWRLLLPPGRNAAAFKRLCCKARRALAGLRVGGIPKPTAFASALVFQRSHLSPRPQFTAARPCLLTVPLCFKLLMLQGTEKTWRECFVPTCRGGCACNVSAESA